MKKIYLLSVLLLFMSCGKEDFDTNEKNFAIPDGSLSKVEKSGEIETNKFINYSDGLAHVMKDEDGLLKLNNIKLVSYKVISTDKYKKWKISTISIH